MKYEFKLQFALLALITVLLIFLSAKTNMRVDFSQNKIYSISQYTKNIFESLDDTVTISWIKSKNAQRYFPNLNYLNALFSQYAAMKHCSFEIVDAGTLTETALQGLGIYPEQVKSTSRDEQKITAIYSGLLIEYSGMTKVLPYVFNLQAIEYTIANTLQALIQDRSGLSNKRRVYILTFPNALNTEYPYIAPFLEYDNFIPITVNDENLTALNPDIPLVVIGSSFFSEAQITMLENFLQAGGSAAFFVSGTEITTSGEWKCTPKQNDKLLELLNRYGFIISQDILFDIFNFPLQMDSIDGMSSQHINYPFWIRINAEQADVTKSFFSAYSTLQMYWPSSLDISYNSNNDATAILSTSSQAKRIIENFTINPFVFSPNDFQAIEKNKYTLAACSTSKSNGQKLFVMADEYFLSRYIELTNSDANITLLNAVCQWLIGNETLLQLKNKTEQIKPFKTFEDKNKIEKIKTFSRCINLIFIPIIIFCIFFFKSMYKNKNYGDSKSCTTDLH